MDKEIFEKEWKTIKRFSKTISIYLKEGGIIFANKFKYWNGYDKIIKFYLNTSIIAYINIDKIECIRTIA